LCLFVTSGNELHVLLVYLYLLENRKQTYRRVVLHMRTTINTKQQQKWRVRDAAAIQIERQTRRRRLCISLFFVCTIARAERSAIRLLVLYSNDQQEGGGCVSACVRLYSLGTTALRAFHRFASATCLTLHTGCTISCDQHPRRHVTKHVQTQRISAV
jgi:hypothetical protein